MWRVNPSRITDEFFRICCTILAVMSDSIKKKCPKCGQQLRFPKNVGGIVMVCPSCGKKFYSDFKIGTVGGGKRQGVATQIFELPGNIISRLVQFFS